MNGYTDKISVILPVYNVARDLPRCLNSIINQTYSNLEIILVNDGSPDQSFQICQDFANQDQRIKVINQANAGRGRARNRGMAAASGDFLAFVDPDDYLTPTYFEHLYQQIHKNDSDIAVCAYRIIRNDDPSHTYPQILTNQDQAVGVYRTCDWFAQYGTLYYQVWLSIAAPWAKLMRRKCMKNVYFPSDRKYAEDTKTMWKFYLNAEKISYAQDFDYIYNQPANSNAKTQLQVVELIRALEEQMAFLLSIGIDISSTRTVYYTTLHTALNLSKQVGDFTNYQRILQKLAYFK